MRVVAAVAVLLAVVVAASAAGWLLGRGEAQPPGGVASPSHGIAHGPSGAPSADAGPGGAASTEPFPVLRETITDPVGLLSARRDEVEQAISEQRSETRIDLRVVVVRSIGGRDVEDFAAEVARRNSLDLGRNALLVVVTDEQRDAVWVSAGVPELGDASLDQIRRQLESGLGEGDPAGGVLSAVRGFRDAVRTAAAPSPSASPTGPSGSRAPFPSDPPGMRAYTRDGFTISVPREWAALDVDAIIDALRDTRPDQADAVDAIGLDVMVPFFATDVRRSSPLTGATANVWTYESDGATLTTVVGREVADLLELESLVHPLKQERVTLPAGQAARLRYIQEYDDGARDVVVEHVVVHGGTVYLVSVVGEEEPGLEEVADAIARTLRIDGPPDDSSPRPGTG